MNKLPFDVNVHSGSIVLDAKSLMSLMALDISKELTVIPITKDWKEIDQFYGVAWSFRVPKFGEE